MKADGHSLSLLGKSKPLMSRLPVFSDSVSLSQEQRVARVRGWWDSVPCNLQAVLAARKHIQEHGREKLVGECQGRCWVHNRTCHVLPMRSSTSKTQSSFTLCVAGASCTDFSKMGLQEKWLGNTALPFLQWWYELMLVLPDAVVLENVKGFDLEVLRDLLPGYRMSVVETCPSDLGIPISRRRLYMIFLREATTSWTEEVQINGVQMTYNQCFHRVVSMYGDTLLRASVEDVSTRVAALASARGLPMERSSGTQWSSWQVMGVGKRARLSAHEAALQESFGSRPPVVTNIAQTTQYAKFTSGLVPSLLKNSDLWSHRLQREALPGELMELQGYVVYPNSKVDICPFWEAMKTHEHSLGKYAGNGMHLACVGTVLLFTLACCAHNNGNLSVPSQPPELQAKTTQRRLATQACSRGVSQRVKVERCVRHCKLLMITQIDDRCGWL